MQSQRGSIRLGGVEVRGVDVDLEPNGHDCFKRYSWPLPGYPVASLRLRMELDDSTWQPHVGDPWILELGSF